MTDVLRLARIEVRRLARLPRTWILLGLFALALVLFGYLAVRAVLSVLATDAAADPALLAESSERAALLAPARLVDNVAAQIGSLLPVLAVLLGAASVRSDHRDHLLRLLVARGVPRHQLALSRLLAQAVFAVVAALVGFGAALLGAIVVHGTAGGLPQPAQVAGLVAIVAVAWLGWAALGLAVATAARSTHAATALAVSWLLVSGWLPSAAQASGLVGQIARRLPTELAATALQALAAGATAPAAWALLIGFVGTGAGLTLWRAVRQPLA